MVSKDASSSPEDSQFVASRLTPPIPCFSSPQTLLLHPEVNSHHDPPVVCMCLEKTSEHRRSYHGVVSDVVVLQGSFSRLGNIAVVVVWVSWGLCSGGPRGKGLLSLAYES